MATPLSEAQLRQFLAEHPSWKAEGQTLLRTFELHNFREAIALVNRVAEVAEAHDHHPDIDIRYKKVTLRLTTHDTGGLSDRDPKVAAACERAFQALGNQR